MVKMKEFSGQLGPCQWLPTPENYCFILCICLLTRDTLVVTCRLTSVVWLNIKVHVQENTHTIHVITTGASFHNASAASAECSSGSVIATLTCGSITCGNPVLDPEGNVPEAIVNGEDAEIESWPWQVSLRDVSINMFYTKYQIANSVKQNMQCNNRGKTTNPQMLISCHITRVSVFVGLLSLLRRLDHQPRVDRIGRALRRLNVSAKSLSNT